MVSWLTQRAFCVNYNFGGTASSYIAFIIITKVQRQQLKCVREQLIT